MTKPAQSKKKRGSLSRDRILQVALKLVDDDGLKSLSMRKVGAKLGVEAMSLYNHVANKDDMLDGIVDLVVAEIELPKPQDDWRQGMHRRAVSAREVFKVHPWAIGVMESRKNPGAASLGYYNGVLGCLRQGGFSVAMAAHAFSLLDSYIYGFSLQETSMPFETTEELTDIAVDMMATMPRDENPYLTEMISEHIMQPGYAYSKEFEFGLNLILDGLARLK